MVIINSSIIKTVIFIDSCFWHGCKKHGSIPATHTKFWTEKIDRNKTRDKEVNKHYKMKGWKVVRIWEHDLKKKNYKFNFDIFEI